MTTETKRRTLREREGDSIRDFVQKAADHGHLDGDVLDFGSGQQPYRDIVEARPAARYFPYDSPTFPGSVADDDTTSGAWQRRFDAILCTQVVQYVEDVEYLLQSFHGRLHPGGALVLTYPTNWPEVEDDDLHRFTRAGMGRLLTVARFEIVWHLLRFEVKLRTSESLQIGYGVVARLRIPEGYLEVHTLDAAEVVP